MKRLLFVLVFISTFLPAQMLNIKGKIISTANNITVLKVWGNHYERGFAQGYLLQDKIDSIYRNYITAKFGTALWQNARDVMRSDANFRIDQVFINEAKGIADGMRAAANHSYDSLDVMAANSFLDLASYGGISPPRSDFNLGCSCLMSWGNATPGLGGKSVITRHLDWEIDPRLYQNQVMVVHLPAEADEQPWIMIGFAGQISVLSGTNKSGVSAFQHVLRGNFGRSDLGMHYEPIWFSIRKALEKKDFNNDGKNNTNDVRDALLANPQGYSAPCIITSSAPSTQNADSLIALVSEVTHVAPTHSFRSTSFADGIPGSNLYAANNAIGTSDSVWFRDRYSSVMLAIGAGDNLDSLKNWEVMRDSSRVVGNNIQFIQVIPELKLLKMSVYSNGLVAYLNTPVWFNLDSLFSTPAAVQDKHSNGLSRDYFLGQNYPNPFNPVTVISYAVSVPGKVSIRIFDLLGNEVATPVNTYKQTGSYTVSFDASGLASGTYFYSMMSGGYISTRKMLVVK